ncbi:MAG: hypothetical protein NTV77_03790 [Candidatus Azambacteria bacterium]|nr:hypothetical protein [Candidatus Azambacteria bacterium]
MNKSKIIFYSIVNSLGVLAYIFLLVSFISNAQKIFGKPPEILISATMLLLFVLSASITGLLVLGRPGHLYFNGYKKEGLILLFSTLACLFVFMVALLGVLFLI